MLSRDGKAPGSATTDHEGQKFVELGERDKRSCSRTHDLSQVSLHYGDSAKVLATVAPDRRWPSMYRIAWPDGRTSDLGNLSRIKDAAVAICQRGPPQRDADAFRWQQIKPLGEAAGSPPSVPPPVGGLPGRRRHQNGGGP